MTQPALAKGVDCGRKSTKEGAEIVKAATIAGTPTGSGIRQ